MTLIWFGGSFLVGSCMFSYWLGQWMNKDLHEVGDGNPGAINLWKAAGARWGIVGIALDFSKGYLPVLLYMKMVSPAGYGPILVATAAILGHMFSPFMHWNGGKAIAVTFGVWSALTDFKASVAYALIMFILLLAFKALKIGRTNSAHADGVQVVLGMMLLSVYLYLFLRTNALLVFWLLNLMMLSYAHRHALAALYRKVFPRKNEQEEHFPHGI